MTGFLLVLPVWLQAIIATLVLVAMALLIVAIWELLTKNSEEVRSFLLEKSFVLPKNSISIEISQLSFVQTIHIQNYLEKQAVTPEQKVKLYKEGDIVFLRPMTGIPSSPEYPCLGSEYAIDCKVMAVKEGPTTFLYKLLSGHGNFCVSDIPQDFIVHPLDREKYEALREVSLVEDTELAPAGTKFSLINGYYTNDALGIYISQERLEQQLNHLFV
jgi:hypothetical protein